MQRIRGNTVIALTLSVASPLGCNEYTAGGSEGDEGASAAMEAQEEAEESVTPELARGGSCDEVAAALKARAIERMEQHLQSSLMDAWSATMYSCEDWGEEEEEEEEEGASEYSQTNTQVEDVDEADFVKNDGSYLYILAGGRFQVLDAWPADQAHVLSSFPIAGVPRRMYVHADTAIIYSALDQEWEGASDYECT